MKWTTLTFKELAAQKTLRMDAKYWIKKKAQASSNKLQAAPRETADAGAASNKHQATSSPQSGGTRQ